MELSLNAAFIGLLSLIVISGIQTVAFIVKFTTLSVSVTHLVELADKIAPKIEKVADHELRITFVERDLRDLRHEVRNAEHAKRLVLDSSDA